MTDCKLALPLHRKLRRANRDCLIRGLYRQLYAALKDDGGASHHILGEVQPLPGCEGLSRSQKALELTHWVMREKLLIKAPSSATMLNIVARKF